MYEKSSDFLLCFLLAIYGGDYYLFEDSETESDSEDFGQEGTEGSEISESPKAVVSSNADGGPKPAELIETSEVDGGTQGTFL